jgi:hypothetical protein
MKQQAALAATPPSLSLSVTEKTKKRAINAKMIEN